MSEAVPDTTLHDAVSKALVPQITEVQSLPASDNDGKPAGVWRPGSSMSDEDMAALDTCGQYGGLTAEGLPCDHPSSFGIPGSRYGITPGRCYAHTTDALEETAKRKAQFLEAYMNQPATLIQICEKLKMSAATPYLWKLTDLHFRRTFEALVVIVDAVRNHIAEDAMFERITDKDAGADTLRMFYHQNRSNGRWRDVRKDPTPQAPSGPVINAGGDVTVIQQKVWQMGDDFVGF